MFVVKLKYQVCITVNKYLPRSASNTATCMAVLAGTHPIRMARPPHIEIEKIHQDICLLPTTVISVNSFDCPVECNGTRSPAGLILDIQKKYVGLVFPTQTRRILIRGRRYLATRVSSMRLTR
ncbi:hypothetical protein ABKN59_008320 [Abortiporus biennis]